MPTPLFTDTSAKETLERILGVSPSATMTVGLYSVLPGADGTGGTEATGGGYARQSITFNAVTLGENSTESAIDVLFQNVQAGTYSYIVIFRSGTIIARGDLPTPKIVATAEDILLPAGQITVTLST